MARAAAAVLAVALAACAAGPPAPAPAAARSDEAVVLAIGERVAVEGFQVEFRAVEADSRCPRGVECMWAGDAVVQVSVAAQGGEAKLLSLHTLQEPKSGSVAGAKVTLLDLVPYPEASEPIDPKAYRATLRIERAE